MFVVFVVVVVAVAVVVVGGLVFVANVVCVGVWLCMFVCVGVLCPVVRIGCWRCVHNTSAISRAADELPNMVDARTYATLLERDFSREPPTYRL